MHWNQTNHGKIRFCTSSKPLFFPFVASLMLRQGNYLPQLFNQDIYFIPFFLLFVFAVLKILEAAPCENPSCHSRARVNQPVNQSVSPLDACTTAQVFFFPPAIWISSPSFPAPVDSWVVNAAFFLVFCLIFLFVLARHDPSKMAVNCVRDSPPCGPGNGRAISTQPRRPRYVYDLSGRLPFGD